MRTIAGSSTLRPSKRVRAANPSARAQRKKTPMAHRQSTLAEGSTAPSSEKGRITTATQNKRLLRGAIIQGSRRDVDDLSSSERIQALVEEQLHLKQVSAVSPLPPR